MTKHQDNPITNCPQWEQLDQNEVESDGTGFLIICSNGPIRLYIYNDDHEFEIVDKKVLEMLNTAGVISDYRISTNRREIRMVNIFQEVKVNGNLIACGRSLSIFKFLQENAGRNLDFLLTAAIEEIKEGDAEGIYIPESYVSSAELIQELL